MQLDNNELVPVVKPKDVSGDWGYPENMAVDYVYIHKTANYENLIVVIDNSVKYIENKVLKPMFDLSVAESVVDITSLGNTLVLSTTNRVLYVLYAEGAYKLLGNKVPFPQIKFSKQRQEVESASIERVYGSATGEPKEDYWYEEIPSEKDWNVSESDSTKTDLLSTVKEKIDNIRYEAQEKSFTNRRFIRYSATLYDGTKLSSLPILLQAADMYDISFKTIKQASLEGEEDYSRVENHLNINISGAYTIKGVLTNLEEFKEWADVVKSIDIFISKGTEAHLDYTRSEIFNRSETQETVERPGIIPVRITNCVCKLKFKAGKDDSEDLLEDSSLVYKIKSIPLRQIEDNVTSPLSSEFLSMKDGFIIYNDVTETNLLMKELLIEDDMKHYPVTAQHHYAFNNQLILLQPTSIVSYGYDWLNNQEESNPDSSSAASSFETFTNYEVTFVLKTADGRDVITKAITINSDMESRVGAVRTYCFQVFPDSRCYRMVVKATTQVRKTPSGIITQNKVSYADLAMQKHPYLNCAFFYDEFNTRLVDLCTLQSAPEIEATSQYDERENAIFVSTMNNPFMFPDNQKFTFPAKVLGGAVATTALSQGQFGQFPMYVFTEDGIYSMETNTEGKFITSKPVTRDVCINPDSITSIDQAVIFVSENGVMLLKGSEVINISPYMLRATQNTSGAQEKIIELTDHKDLLPTIKEKEAFMDFMEETKVIYDYPGKRLIFARPDRSYQYVYKLNTQTWHKLNQETTNIKPLNSYPRALGIVEGEKSYSIKYQYPPLPRDVSEDFELLREVVSEFNKNYNHYAYGFLKITNEELLSFLNGTSTINVSHLGYSSKGQDIINFFGSYGFPCDWSIYNATHIYDFSCIHNGKEGAQPTKGVVITRPFDLGEPDVMKSITDVRVRGDFGKGAVKFILEGSNNGHEFYVLNSLRGRSWKMFRLTILADLDINDRISWVDIQYETRFTNKLR